MRESEKDLVRLHHILESIDTLIETTKDLNIENLDTKDLRYFGIVKLLEIIGEASYKLTNKFREEHSQTPWKEIISMRHVMVHGYYTINRSTVNFTIKKELIPLKNQIQNYIQELSSSL